MLENNLVEENGPTEISHQGLDCDDDEEEEDSTKVPEQVTLSFSQKLDNKTPASKERSSECTKNSILQS